MDWIAKYRLNPDWFFPEDEPDVEKTNREEIYELIKNLVNELIKSKNRDSKLNKILS